MMGRMAEAGRPMLYGTSQQFLEHFGLRELGDLPTLREINELIGITESAAGTHPPSDGPQPAAETRQTDVEPGSDVDEPVATNEAPAGSRVLDSPPGDDRPGTASRDADRAAATGASADPPRDETSG
jgi:hypothetical protein